MKHTTTRKDISFLLSDLKDTFVGFSKRFLANKSIKNTEYKIITNRPIEKNLKDTIDLIIKNENYDKRKFNTLKKYTNLTNEDLVIFCKQLELIDDEGDYQEQKYELQREVSEIISGTIDNTILDTIEALVKERALPNSDGVIKKEDILSRFGVSNERELYPAPTVFEKVDSIIFIKKHYDLAKNIINRREKTIVHASGGVGKSIFATQIPKYLEEGSVGIVYDCFGAGRYRNRSELRHRHKDAFVQLSNELATKGLCNPLLYTGKETEDQLMKSFLIRLDVAVKNIRKSNEDAVLMLVIDAADNAEMVAKENNDSCFAHEILREDLPDGCILITLCRTERINLLDPVGRILKEELEPFSEAETFQNLKQYYPSASKENAKEFHRLTNNGNPRVQANALNGKFDSIEILLSSLGPYGQKLQDQIEMQLNSSLINLKDKYPVEYQDQIDRICTGISVLPPFIPIEVLSRVSGLTKEAIKSFVVDLGRAIWLSDTSIHFRDEPTETWFRNKFCADEEQINMYIGILEQLSETSNYVAEVIPCLLLQSGNYQKLINIALSDRLLPVNPTDRRNVKLFRLQFAFKAALKLRNYKDTIKLSLLAGEEFAGNERQLELFKKNIDLISPLLSQEHVQQIAYKHLLRSGWEGSENIFSASLLSTVNNFVGESHAYFRSANNWISIQLEKSKSNFHNEISDEEILELTYTTYNLFGISEALNYLFRWKPDYLAFKIGVGLVKRIIDTGNNSKMEELRALDVKNLYFILALVSELMKVGKYVYQNILNDYLVILESNKSESNPINIDHKGLYEEMISFLEACAINSLDKSLILLVLNTYFPLELVRNKSWSQKRRIETSILRALALRCVLTDEKQYSFDELLNLEKNEKKKTKQNDLEDMKILINGLLPLYIVRCKVIIDSSNDISKELENAIKEYEKIDSYQYSRVMEFPFIASQIFYDIFIYSKILQKQKDENYYKKFIRSREYIWPDDLIDFLRKANHLMILEEIRLDIENFVFETITYYHADSPEEKADLYICLARAVIINNLGNASAYFEKAVESISKFGEELVQRWNAITSLAEIASMGKNNDDELAYRFIRCAELIGESVPREKYWNRTEAIKICGMISINASFATLSRWRDRDVGYGERLLKNLLVYCVKNKIINPTVAWSFLKLIDIYDVKELIASCLEIETREDIKKTFLSDAIEELRFTNISKDNWKELYILTNKHNLNIKPIDELSKFYSPGDNHNDTNDFGEDFVTHSSEINWNEIFLNVDTSSKFGIEEAILRSKKLIINNEFWKELYGKSSFSNALKTLEQLLLVETITFYSMQDAILSIPVIWKKQLSFQKNWPSFLKKVAIKYTTNLTEYDGLHYFIKSSGIPIEDKKYIIDGIIECLASNMTLENSVSYFGFVKSTCHLLEVNEAKELLMYSLERLEIHIPESFGDGVWKEWLTPPKEIFQATTGFIWASLGSPDCSTRWDAVHTVKKLGELNCEREIDSLISWFIYGKVDSFGYIGYPFYVLNAKLYLLIALARLSYINVDILKKYSQVFRDIAINETHHVLIQKFTLEIVTNIEKKYPTHYSNVDMKLINQLPYANSIKNETSIIGTNLKELSDFYKKNKEKDYYYGIDFPPYWFNRLARLFNLKDKDISNLVNQVIQEDWKLDFSDKYIRDPRENIWRSHRKMETYHSHGTHPKIEDFSFYLSYHSLFIVAGKLYSKFKYENKNLSSDDTWNDWINDYLLERNDGRWLSDRRDFIPLKESNLSLEINTENWENEITIRNFWDGIIRHENNQTWITIFGNFEESHWSGRENFNISSALVPIELSNSLLQALDSYKDSHDFKLPEYEEENFEIDFSSFNLKGWLYREYAKEGLDKFDFSSGGIHFNPVKIGEKFIHQFNMKTDSDFRSWFIENEEKPLLISKIWSSNIDDESSLKKGNIMEASVEFLKELCRECNCNLIINVDIRRKRQRQESEERYGYKPSIFRNFIFTASGELRTTRESFKFGKINN